MHEFFSRFEDFPSWTQNQQADYIAYYLIKLEGKDSVNATLITSIADQLDLKKHKRLPQYLSESASSRHPKYIRVSPGSYRLERGTFDTIDRKINNEPTKVAVDAQLIKLVESIGDDDENSFLNEAVNCYRIQANRAAIIMIWIVTMNHLQKYIFAKHLSSFNAAFALNPEKKINKIMLFDDFSALPENKFIEITKSAGIITNDVRKLLDEKLGTRNSAAHPSNISISGHKATEFALDLISNILIKYPL